MGLGVKQSAGLASAFAALLTVNVPRPASSGRRHCDRMRSRVDDRGALVPSFDIVSEFERHEAQNAVDQANREVSTRFDFRGSDASYSLEGDVITMQGSGDFQLKQMLEILQSKLHRRGIDIACLDVGDSQPKGKMRVQPVTLRQGIDSDVARKIVKLIKDKKMKVQAAIQGDKVRVTGKKRDDLQRVIALLREQDFGLPLQFNNFRD